MTPPCVGEAVNVTDVPAHTGFTVGETETLTGRFGLTIIVIVFDVAGLFEIQTEMEEIKTQLTWSPFNGV